MKTDDPICGNCGKKRSQHYREDQLYCNTRTNGDVFTDTPNDYHLVGYLKSWIGLTRRGDLRKARCRMQAKIQISERKEVKASGHKFILVPDPKHPGRHTLTIKPIALDTKEKTAKT